MSDHPSRCRLLILFVVLTLHGSASARAQKPTDSRCAFDTAARTRLQSLTVGLSPAGPNLVPVSGPDEVLWIADAIRAHFEPPAQLSVPVWARISGGIGKPLADSDTIVRVRTVGHGLDDFIVLNLTPAGRLADRKVSVNTASPELNANLLRAILRADSLGAFTPLSDSLRRAGGRVRLRIVDHDSGHVRSVPLFRMTFAAIRADSGVRVLAGPQITFPRNALRVGVADSIVIGYVVGEDGRYMPGTVHVIRARFLDFIEAVERGLARARFRPALIEGCAVPSAVRQSFSFAIRR